MDESIAAGVMSLLRWALAFGYWMLIFSTQCEAVDKEQGMTPSEVKKSRIAAVLKTLGYSAVFTLMVGAGGTSCESYDSFGCAERSEDYRAPWGWSQLIEFYIPAAGIALLAWWMATQGYRLKR